jgi:hypothetical protein
MTVNKELLIKHKFWGLLGLFALLWLIAMFTLPFLAGAEIKKNKEAYAKADTDIKNAQKKGPKSPKFLPPWEKHKEMFQDHKNVVWRQGWKLQQGIYTWPDELDKKLQDPNPRVKYNASVEYRNKLYNMQMEELFNAHWIAPVEMHGGKDEQEAFKTIMAPVGWDPDHAPTHEEIWLAQEDFWVKRELLWVVRAVLDGQARMVKVEVDPKKEPLPEGILSRHRFRNTTWEIDFLIEKGDQKRNQRISARSTIKNIHPARRTLALANPHQKPLKFRLVQDQVRVDLEVTGEPLPPWIDEPAKDGKDKEGDSAEKKAEKKFAEFKKPWDSRIDFQKPFTVEQVFDWYSAPIKRLDKLVLGQQSARTVTTALKPNLSLPQDDSREDAPDAGAGGPAKGGAGGGPSPAGPKGGMPGMASGGGPPGAAPGAPPGGRSGGGGDEETGNRQTPTAKIDRARYLQVQYRDPKQPKMGSVCRHLPLGMVLIVDQAVIPDVLAAIANSRLRIQVTQVQLQHVHNIKPEHTLTPAAPAAGRPEQPNGPGPMGMPDRGGTSGAGQAAKPAGEEEDPNLVELAVYGIAALYEHFDPARDAAPGDSAGPANTTGTGGSAPPKTPAPGGPRR